MSKSSPKASLDLKGIVPIAGFLLMAGGLVINFFVQDARTNDQVARIDKEVEELQEENQQQEEQIEQTDRQYQLINQSLGSIQDTLKELKGRR